MNKKKKTLHKTGSLAVTNIVFEREGKKIKKKEKEVITTWVFEFVTRPSRNPAEQGLTLLSGQGAVLPLWYYDSTSDNFFYF